MIDILSMLEGVRPNGNGHIAKCPAHEDRSPSLAVTTADDGNILINCFAGCSALQVVESLGLRLSDLFAEDREYEKPARKWNYKNLIEVMAHEALVVSIAARDISQGKQLGKEDHERLLNAAIKINNIREIACGKH